jgi:hypothetical protein
MEFLKVQYLVSGTITEKTDGRGERVRTGKPANGVVRLSFVICKLLSSVIITGI